MSDQGGSSLLQAEFAIDALTPAQLAAARRLVDRYARNNAERVDFLETLGIEVGA